MAVQNPISYWLFGLLCWCCQCQIEYFPGILCMILFQLIKLFNSILWIFCSILLYCVFYFILSVYFILFWLIMVTASSVQTSLKSTVPPKDWRFQFNWNWTESILRKKAKNCRNKYYHNVWGGEMYCQAAPAMVVKRIPAVKGWLDMQPALITKSHVWHYSSSAEWCRV